MEKAKIITDPEDIVRHEIKRKYFGTEDLFWDINTLGGVIAGGYVRYIASPNKHPIEPDDVDVFCRSRKSFARLKALFSRVLAQISETNFFIQYKTDIRKSFDMASPSINLQLIKPYDVGLLKTFGSPQEIISNFDLSVIRCYLDREVGFESVFSDSDFAKDESTKTIRLKFINNPIAAAIRVAKYSRKGYWLPIKEALKLFKAWDKMPVEIQLKLEDFINANFADLNSKEITQFYQLLRGASLTDPNPHPLDCEEQVAYG